MSFATQKAAIIKWLSLSSGLPVGKVIWTDQNMPRPVRPYIAVNMTGFKTINREYIAPQTEDGVVKIIEHKEYVLPIQYFADNAGSTDPIEKLSNVQSAIHTQQIQDLFIPEGIVFVRVLFGPDCTSIKIDAMSESRGGMDLQFRMPWVMEDKGQGSIEAVSVEGVVKNIDGTTVDARSYTVGAEFEPTVLSATGTFVSIDTLLETINVQVGANQIAFKYDALTVVILNTAPAVITDLQAGDALEIDYIEFHGNHLLKTVDATRT